MGKIKKVLCVLLVVFSLFYGGESGRYSGGNRRTNSRPSYRPAPHRPSYPSHPAPQSHPAPSYHPPAPSAPRPPAYHPPSPNPAPQRPIGFDTHSSGSNGQPVGPPTNAKPVGSSSGAANNPPNYGFKPDVTGGHPPAGSNNPPAYGWKAPGTDHQGGGGSNVKPGAPPVAQGPSRQTVSGVGNAPPPPGAPFQIHPPPYSPHSYGHAPPAYNPGYHPAGAPPAYNPAGYGPPPPYGGYQPPQQQHGLYPQQGYHANGYHPQGGAGGVTIVNNVNQVGHGGYGGGYGGGFGGYTPSYHYGSSDVGSGTLGFFLGYSLAKLTTPTFHSHSFYDGYTPRYDHYTVHHYYHNNNDIPKESTIQPNAIVGCPGDSGTICPAGTTSLCTSNGAILCVASATSTVPCSDVNQRNCVKSYVPCVQGTNCDSGKNTTEVSIPCISTAKVFGNITYVNNNIVIQNNTTILQNSTTNATTSDNSTITTTMAPAMANGAIISANETSTEVPRVKREAAGVPQSFCVTILALPAERKPTEGEKVASQTMSLFTNFLEKSLGAA